MANIDSYLEQIRSAVYGEEVRGSIHDAISAINQDYRGYVDGVLDEIDSRIEGCEGNLKSGLNSLDIKLGEAVLETNKVAHRVADIEQSLIEPVSFHGRSSTAWLHVENGVCLSNYQGCGSGWVRVYPGEIYRVMAGYYEGHLVGGLPLIIMVADLNNEHISEETTILTKTFEYETLNGAAVDSNEHWVIIPDGCRYMLINSASNTFAMSVQRVKYPLSGLLSKPNSSSGGGLNLLWSGILIGNTGDGVDVEFTIPEQCFFNEGKELILAVNGYYSREDELAYDLYTMGLCFGDPDELGLADGQRAPYRYGNFMRRVSRTDSWQSSSQTLALDIEVTKVADSRYATCVVTNRSPNFYMTSVSAMIAK